MSVLLLFVQRYWALLSGLMLALVTLASLFPVAQLPSVPGSDKTHHFVSYAAVVFPIALAKPKHWLWLALLVIGWSGAIELIQPYVNRYGEWLDLAANSAGVLIGILLAMLSRRLFLKSST